MIEINVEFPQRELVQATAIVDNETRFTSDVIISAKPEITGVTASVDNSTGVPYVDVTETGTGRDFSFDLAFHNLKGEQGERGEQGETGATGADGKDGKDGTDGLNAEITGATATIDGNIGTPSVSVTAGGTALARSFAFAFSNLKGETGAAGQDGTDGTNAEITGVTASVDNNTGIPYVDVTMGGTSQARTFDFAFHNLKGSGGGGGVSDVKVNNTSVVTSGVANIDLTGYVQTSDLATVATSGSYNDLINTPTIPAAQVNSDWNSSSGVSEILNKPTIPTVYNSTITFTQGGVQKGSINLNQSSDGTIALDGGGGGSLTSILEAIYPVGSIYATTDYNSGVCPLESLFTSSWSLLSSTIVTDVGSGSSVSTSEAVAIQGNGKTAIMADDPSTEGLGAIQIGYSTSNNYYLTLSNSDTSQNLIANSGNYSTNKHKLGFSKLATKTGLIGSVTIPSITITPSKTTQTVYLFQRTA